MGQPTSAATSSAGNGSTMPPQPLTGDLWRSGKRLCKLGDIPRRHGSTMELRHLRYFIAVAETGSLTEAAERRLHTSQPSLSRQIRDLEYEVGAELLSRCVHGVELTAAGKAFAEHARLALNHAEAAAEAARRA